MLSAFSRIMLALAMAFVFTGQMEAAAAHCAKLAQDEVVEPIAPYGWLLPEAASFASIDPAPGLRPPRA